MPVLFFTEKKVSLAVKLAVGYSDQKENLLFNLAMAGIVYYTLPVVIVFFSLQKQFVAGLLSGGLKG
jgi:ABC-type glycerol-3-phosphate transport system permease component